jgi:hypothetical protein
MLATTFTGLIPGLFIAAGALLCGVISFAPARFGHRSALVLLAPSILIGLLCLGALIWQEFDEHDPDFLAATVVPLAFVALGTSSLFVYRRRRRTAKLKSVERIDNGANAA